MALSCTVIRDLLPLYAEDLLQEGSRILVEEHLVTCEACQKELEALREPAPPQTETLPLLSVKKLLRKQNLAWGLIAAGLVAAILLTVITWITRAQPVSLNTDQLHVFAAKEGIFLRLTAPAELRLKLDAELFTDEYGRTCAAITSYSSPWLQLFGSDSRDWTSRVKIADEALERVYYCDYTKGGDMQLLYGSTTPYDSAGVMTLPRLVLNYYLQIAVLLTAAFGLFALLLRKREAGRTLGYLSLVFGCYTGGHLLTKGWNGISYAPVQDLIFILLVGGSLFLLFLGILQLQKLSRSGIE